MINKYTNKQRGLLAVIMAMVMVFAGAAFIAAEVDATGATELDEDTHVVSLKQNETTTYYADFKTAWDYAVSQNADFTIDLLKDTNSDGVKTTPKFKGNIILNLNDHTLTFGPNGAGSKGTETSAFQLRAEAKSVTINGGIEGKGIITSGGEENSNILRMIQTYTELTLNDVTIDGSKMLPGMYGSNPADYVTVSVGNGSLAITGSTSIIAHEPVAPRAAYALAFGTNNLSSYVSTSVTIETTGTIEGITFGAGKDSTNSLTVNAIGTNSGITINEDTSGHDFNIFIKKGVAINVFVPENMIANGTISFGDKVNSEKKDIAKFEGVVAGSDGITISEGSVKISGTVDASSNVVITATGEVYLDGVEITANAGSTGSLTVTAIGEGNNVIIDGLTVGKDATLAVGTSNVTMEGANVIDGTITGSFTIAENSTMILNGDANGATVTNKGTISVGDSNATLPGTIIGDGKIDASAVQENVDIGGIIKSNATFGIEQIVTIVSDTEIVGSKSGDTENITILTINGSLIIPEGVTLTIGEYSALIIDGYNAKLINNGTIVVESKGIVLDNGTNGNISTGADVANGSFVAFAINKASAENNGTIILDYTEGVAMQGFNGSYAMHIQNTVFQNNGTILIEEENTLGICRNDIDTGSKDVTAINNNAGSEIVSYGAIIGYINNKSTITIDGYALGFISMQSTDAVLNIVELRALPWDANYPTTGKVTLTIGDDGLKHGKVTFDDTVNYVKINVDKTDRYALQGLVVKSVVKAYDDDDNGKIDNDDYFKLFDISGSLVNETEEEVTADITVTLDGRTIVSSELSVSEGVTIAGASTDEKIMYITGNVMLSKDSTFTADYVTVYGKMISEIEDVDDGKHFVASKYEIKADLVNKTPAQVIYTTLAQAIADGATKIECLGNITIDTEITIPAGTTVRANTISVKEAGFLTLADGAKLTADDIDVDGVFAVENKKNLSVSTANITSDVVTSDDKSVLYSGLAYALSVATDGQTVEISKYVGSANVTLTSDATIKVGVILDTNNTDIKVDNDVTLTIDGVLFLDNSKISVEQKNDDGTKGAGEVVLNGTIKSVKAMDYNIGSTPLSAAYYVKIENSMAYNYVEPVSVAAPKILEADEAEMEIKSFVNDMKIGNVSFTGTTEKAVTVTVIGNVSGNITVEEGTVAIQSGKFVGTVTDGVGTIVLDGTTSNAADKALKVASVTDDDDEKAFTVSGEFAPSDKKKVTLSGEVVITKFKATPVTVEGNVKVIDASNIDVLTVNGTVTIPNEVTLTVEDAYVFGSITVSEPTDKPAGKLVATDLYVGLEKKDVYKTTTGASASVTGNTSVSNHLFVLAGTTIPEDLVKEDTPYQELYVEGELWMTIYALGTDFDVPVNQIPVDDVKFEGWASEEGKDGKDNFTVKIENKKVYADIEYDVYIVVVTASEGIDDVYLDGALMLNEGLLYSATVAAGTHTISYTLANGYTGEAKMLVDGKEVSGYTFTAEGEFDNKSVDYMITLQGIEKAPAEVGGGDVPSADKDEGMDLTDILLIVLVVLIVIMAIIVALRMMRS